MTASPLSFGDVSLSLDVRRFDPATSLSSTVAAVPLVINQAMDLNAGCARLTARATAEPSPRGGTLLKIDVEALDGQIDEASLRLVFRTQSWSKQHYLLMPAAVYNGNRNRVFHTYRAERFPDLGPDAAIWQGPNPARLNIESGPSRIDLLTSDMTIPAVAIHSPAGGALLVLADDRTPLGLSGMGLEENDARTAAEFWIAAPGVRELRPNPRKPRDQGASWSKGKKLSFRCIIHEFSAANVQAVYDKLWDVRHELRPPPRVRHEIPFSATWATQERKQNEQNWVEKYGYFSVGMRESVPQDWQSGWVGGLNATFPLLADGDAITRKRAARTFDFLLDGGIAPSGFIRSTFHEGKWNTDERVFLRYSGDGLYFLIKSFELLQSRDGKAAVPSTWQRMARGVAEAFCRIWDQYGQLGHFAGSKRDDLRCGNSCAAAVGIGGLAIAARYFNEPKFLQVAEASGRLYHQQYVRRGQTNGGPGDILLAQDSESCFGLLESFITLYDVTGNAEWIGAARDTANQCASWVVNYDFKFPDTSTFGKLDMLTNGTVWANVQNKHSAPGICTLSGLSLLKLFRATGDLRYLELIRDIAHAIPQYMSRADRPITDRRPNQRWPIMPPGWINERVNLSDWEVRGEPDEEIGVGEIFGGSTWSEPAMLLTTVELPGVYAQPDTGLLVALDHVNAEWSKDCKTITLHNPTKFDAAVKLLIEPSTATSKPLGAHWLPTQRLDVPAGKSATVSLG